MEVRDLFELENDHSFQQLNHYVNSFNTLKILKIENHEIRHSNILAWLLDPKENHHLGDYFLRKMMEHLVLLEENTNNLQYEKLSHILNYSLADCYVYREVKTDKGRFIDLVIVNHQLKCVILIENKFYSTESINQLDDYLHYIQEQFVDYTTIPVYLTLDGEEPSSDEYFSLTYERIESILQTILMLYEDRVNEDVYRFIEDYHHLLRERFYPNQEQILLAIDIYRNYKSTINALFEETSILHKQLQFEPNYHFEFMMKYKDTINYIFKHGQNIMSYSFEQFIRQQFDEEVLFQSHPTKPNLLPPEWNAISRLQLREHNYWLGKGLIVWFEQTNDKRLRLIAEIGPIEYKNRLWLLEQLEKNGFSIRESSKLEKARYTRFYSQKADVNKWDDMNELKLTMADLYNSLDFNLIRKQVAAVLNKEQLLDKNIESLIVKDDSQESTIRVQLAFKKWMASKNYSKNNYRVSPRTLSFKIPLFDHFKEKLGETREKWWWDNGPFLFWININNESLFFVLEVGPIEADKRVKLMELLQEKGVKFNKKGLTIEAKYNRIHTKSFVIRDLDEVGLMNAFDTLFQNEKLQNILMKLQSIYDEQISKLD